MTWRGLGALLLLILVGGGAGFGVATLLDRPGDPSGAPKPLTATNPSYPYTPPIRVQPDPEEPPPLRAPFDTRPDTLGGGPFAVAFPVPVGWVRSNTAAGEIRYVLPGDPAFTYSVRIEQVSSQPRSVPDWVSSRIDDLSEATGISDYRTIRATDNELVCSYVQDRHRRIQVVRWLSPRGGTNAEIEVAAVGRVVDQAGLEDLVGLIAAEIRPAEL